MKENKSVRYSGFLNHSVIGVGFMNPVSRFFEDSPFSFLLDVPCEDVMSSSGDSLLFAGLRRLNTAYASASASAMSSGVSRENERGKNGLISSKCSSIPFLRVLTGSESVSSGVIARRIPFFSLLL